jgi:hypothetical protein
VPLTKGESSAGISQFWAGFAGPYWAIFAQRDDRQGNSLKEFKAHDVVTIIARGGTKLNAGRSSSNRTI